MVLACTSRSNLPSNPLFFLGNRPKTSDARESRHHTSCPGQTIGIDVSAFDVTSITKLS